MYQIFFQNERCDAQEFKSLFWNVNVKDFNRREASWRRMLVVGGREGGAGVGGRLKITERIQDVGG